MRTLSPDTCREVEQIHIELIRKAPIFRRLQMVSSLVKTTRQLSWQGICERYPGDMLQIRVKRFISLLYKDERLVQQFTDLLIKKGIC